MVMTPSPKQNTMHIAYTGKPGAYSHLAAQKALGNAVSYMAFPTFASCLQALDQSEATFAILPYENSIAGPVAPTRDLIQGTSHPICAEVQLSIHHCLLAHASTSIHEVKTVLSHPQALAQCSDYLTKMGWDTESYSNTAAAAEYLSQNPLPNTAVIANRESAERYHLKILQADIANAPDNMTRFLIFGDPNQFSKLQPESKTLKLLEPHPIIR